MCIPPDPIPPPTEKSFELVNQLRILLYIQLALGIIRLFTSQFSLGFDDLISCLILYMGYAQLSYCNMIMYICFNGFSAAYVINAVGTIIQDNQPPFPNNQMFNYTILYASLAFYFVSIYYGFEAYKEFKALLVEGALGGGAYMGMGGFGALAQGAGSRQNAVRDSSYDEEAQSRPQQGSYRPPDANTNTRGPGPQPKSGGGFQAFGGRGVSLG